MPVFRFKNGKKTTKLYLDEIRRLHSTRDLLADLALNQPMVLDYDLARQCLTKVCDLWPIPEPKGKKVDAEYSAAEMAQPSHSPCDDSSVDEETESPGEGEPMYATRDREAQQCLDAS